MTPDPQARSDHDQTRRFFNAVVSDSQLEMPGWMRLLKAGLTAIRVAPQRANFRILPVVDPVTREVVGDIPVPALSGEVRGSRS